MAHKFFINRARKLEVVTKHADGADFVYMVSKECNLRESSAGVVCLMSLERAAESLVEESYEFASQDQIDAYNSKQSKDAERITEAEFKRSGGIPGLVDALSLVKGNRAAKSSGRAV